MAQIGAGATRRNQRPQATRDTDSSEFHGQLVVQHPECLLYQLVDPRTSTRFPYPNPLPSEATDGVSCQWAHTHDDRWLSGSGSRSGRLFFDATESKDG